MTKLNAFPLTRRGFLICAGASGLVCGFTTPALATWSPLGTSAPTTAPTFDPTLWYAIDATGLVTVNIIRAELGQHIGTAIARILADELEVDWAQVRITHVDTDPKWGHHGHWRQLVGLAKLSDLCASRCRRAHRPD